MSQSVANGPSVEPESSDSQRPLKRRTSNASVASNRSVKSSIFSLLSFSSDHREQPAGKYVVVYEPLDKKLSLDTPENIISKSPKTLQI